MAKPYSSTLFITSLIFFYFSSAKASTNQDLEALLEFKSGADKANRLSFWNSTAADPCAWDGVSCVKNRVSRLVLEDLKLSGSLEPLTSLTELRVLSLKRNEFTGSVPNLANLTSLKLLFLSHNRFDSRFPDSVDSLFRLYRLDLSFNNFSGEIPVSVNHLSHLLTLRLEGNRFSGPISGLDLPIIQDFNVSGNQLSGKIPDSLSGLPESAFSKNGALCGSPIKKCDDIPSDPTRTGTGGAFASPFMPATVSSSPTSMPKNGNPVGSPKARRNGNIASKMSPVAIIAIILGDVLVLAVVSFILYCYFWRNYAAKMRDGGKGSKVFEGEKIVYSSSPYQIQSGLDRGRMVFFEGAKRFELEDLLRASAEMLGKGGFGTAYKAVLDDGGVVAVKRLKDANVGAKREFEQHMEVLGRLRHLNVVGLKAYYFAREEKLLVYDYMPNGSLFWVLHGNRGPGRIPLDWTSRLKIATGAAHGIAFIHTTCKTIKLTHGNIKSTNVLLDKAGNACVSDFGLSVFAFPAANAPRSNSYRAPELSPDARKTATQKSDVYSFGVLLLELLTGKCPSHVDGGGGYGGVPVDLPRWVQSVVWEEWTAEVFDLELMRYKDIEEEMVGLLQVAMACTSASPDQRPKMSHVIRMVEEIRMMEVVSVS